MPDAVLYSPFAKKVAVSTKVIGSIFSAWSNKRLDKEKLQDGSVSGALFDPRIPKNVSRLREITEFSTLPHGANISSGKIRFADGSVLTGFDSVGRLSEIFTIKS